MDICLKSEQLDNKFVNFSIVGHFILQYLHRVHKFVTMMVVHILALQYILVKYFKKTHG